MTNLHKINYNILPKSNIHINNSFYLVNEKRLNDDFKLISLDVVPMCTNILIDLTVESIFNRKDGIYRNIFIPFNEFLIMVGSILSFISFKFNNKFYK